jgi:hypothetical protein
MLWRFILSILPIYVNRFSESLTAQRLRIHLAGKAAYRTLARREEKRFLTPFRSPQYGNGVFQGLAGVRLVFMRRYHPR